MNVADYWFDKSFRTISEIIGWYNDGSFISNDPKYNIPPVISDNIAESDLEIMFCGGLIRLFGVQDDRGCVHINEHDYQIVRHFVESVNPELEPVKRRRRMNLSVLCIFLDYRSDNDLKEHFFERILK